MKIACVGEAMIELVVSQVPGSAQLSVAGDTLNTAIYLRRALSDQHEVHFITALGKDHLSDQMLAFMRAEGVQTDGVTRVADRLPGIYSITTDASGERSFEYWRQNSAARTLFQRGEVNDFSVLDQFDMVYASAISLAILPQKVRVELLGWLEGFRERGGLFAFDSNYRPRLWEDRKTAQSCVSKAWSICDIALPSVDDEIDLFGGDEAAVLERFRGYPSCKGALKRGALGPLPLNSPLDGSLTYPRAHSVVDTTAAGDSFSGAFIGSFIEDGSVDMAMSLAHRYASIVIGHSGAIISRKQLSDGLSAGDGST